MVEREGYVERIIFRNADNGYTVFEMADEDTDELVCVGSFPFINEGEYIVVKGEMIDHNVYGEQLKVSSFQVKDPEDLIAVQRYLASGAIQGIRAGLAKRIIDK